MAFYSIFVSGDSSHNDRQSVTEYVHKLRDRDETVLNYMVVSSVR